MGTTVPFDNLDKLTKLVDLTFSLDTKESDSPLYKLWTSIHRWLGSFVESHEQKLSDGQVSLIPQVGNITSGDDVAKRYYYEGKCFGTEQNPCISIKIKDVVLRAPYEAKFIVLIHDRRP